MFESVQRHGPFDERYPARQKPPSPTSGERLEWAAFLERFFPNRRRHDFAALAAYDAYRSDPDPRPAMASSLTPIAASTVAVSSWESEGGAASWVPAEVGSAEE